MPADPNRNISTTFVKGIRVLKAFDDANTHLALADLAARTGLDRASVRRLVLTLVELGYVRKTGRHFVLTPRVLTLAGSFFQGNAVGTEVQPLLNQYSERLDGPASLALRDGDAAVYVCQSAPRAQPVTFGFTVGSRLSLTHSAIGRMLLACEDETWTDAFLNRCPLERHTPGSIVDREALRRAVAACREQGAAVIADEFEFGITGLAVPVSRENALRAVVGTSFPTTDVAGDGDQARILRILRDLAREMAHTRMFNQA